MLYTVEVKSTLTADGLRQAHYGALRIDGFDYQPGFHSLFNGPVELRIWKVIPPLFAFESDLVPQGRRNR